MFATADGGDQLRIVERPFRQLVEFVLAADDADDLGRIRAAAATHDVAVTEETDGSLSLAEPVTGIRARVCVRPRDRRDERTSRRR